MHHRSAAAACALLTAAAATAAVPAAPPAAPPAAAAAVPMAPSEATGGASPEPGASSSVPEGTGEVFTVSDPRISESSGMAASARHEGVVWTHNDSGEHAPQVFAVDGDGETAATLTLGGEGVELRDWEAVAVAEVGDGEPAVYVGDIGDNFQGGWPSIRVYRFTEPETLADAAVTPEVFTFTYADGGRDAEAMMVDPRDGRLYVVSKEVAGGVYAAPETLDPDGTNTLERVDSAPLYATDAAFSPDGSHYAIRTYWGVTFYDASEGVPGKSVGRVGLPESEQGESLTYDGTSVLVGTEGVQSPVWEVPIPEHMRGAGADGEGSPSEEASPEPDAAAETTGPGAWTFILTGAGVAAAVIAGIVLLVRKA
ncbi:hypothetical protein [Nocardiopsis suaedae]|uniref:WD40 repeat domain-containing protein n=1 Tax=Nocardiopsis suaedae TaxID=3018444 RepID=A0ABT4TMG9_9ACTN|nr:hypothetical protein [Nocardiopsis suaedae]MDA2805860.1 hypothetical protein [Nocardiopsis suaedae]